MMQHTAEVAYGRTSRAGTGWRLTPILPGLAQGSAPNGQCEGFDAPGLVAEALEIEQTEQDHLCTAILWIVNRIRHIDTHGELHHSQ